MVKGSLVNSQSILTCAGISSTSLAAVSRAAHFKVKTTGYQPVSGFMDFGTNAEVTLDLSPVNDLPWLANC